MQFSYLIDQSGHACYVQSTVTACQDIAAYLYSYSRKLLFHVLYIVLMWFLEESERIILRLFLYHVHGLSPWHLHMFPR